MPLVNYHSNDPLRNQPYFEPVSLDLGLFVGYLIMFQGFRPQSWKIAHLKNLKVLIDQDFIKG